MFQMPGGIQRHFCDHCFNHVYSDKFDGSELACISGAPVVMALKMGTCTASHCTSPLAPATLRHALRYNVLGHHKSFGAGLQVLPLGLLPRDMHMRLHAKAVHIFYPERATEIHDNQPKW